MAGPAARHDQYDIETKIEIGEMRMATEEMRGGTLQPALLARKERLDCGVVETARLDLDNGERAAPPDHHIDFARRRFQAAGENAISLQTQVEGSVPFRTKTETMGGPARGGIPLASSADEDAAGFHFAPDSSSARA